MTALILGTANVGLAYGQALQRPLPSDVKADALFAAAENAGFAALDTAAAYGLSEQRIGAYYRDHAKSTLAVHTKLHPKIDQAGLLEGALMASTQALGQSPTQTLLHRWDQRSADNGALWRALCKARDAGLTGEIGASVQSPQEALAAMSNPEIEVIQLACNLLDWRYETPELRDAFLASRARVEVRSVFLQGLLTLNPMMRWPTLPVSYDPVGLADFIASQSRRWATGDAVALSIRFALSLEWVDALVLGADTPAQIRSLAQIAADGALAVEAVTDIRANRPQVPGALLDPSRWL